MQAVSMHSYEEIAPRLAQSKFRSRFRLGRRELACVAEKGFPVIEAQCREIIRRRLGPAVIPNDGRQTPWRGHPCFIAQHATGCCCRGCLRKWHGIPEGRALSDEEISAIAALLLGWLRAHAAGAGELPPYARILF